MCQMSLTPPPLATSLEAFLANTVIGNYGMACSGKGRGDVSFHRKKLTQEGDSSLSDHPTYTWQLLANFY